MCKISTKIIYYNLLSLLIGIIDNDLISISIPAISSGIYGFPKDLCAKIMI